METGKNRVWLGERNLYFDFPNVHPEARLRINFRRTLRVPDDGRDYPLPASLGFYPVFTDGLETPKISCPALRLDGASLGCEIALCS
jgi:hypothetical protein